MPAERVLKFYGRRKGKPLRAGKAAAHEDVLPHAGIALPQNGAPVDPQAFFPALSRIELEIGFGDGEHLLHRAINSPDTGFIGCEPFVNGVAALCVGIQKHGLKNIRIWPDDARKFMVCLKKNSLSRCYLLNSDPWPKTRHHKRRFIQKETLDELHRLLKPGAELVMSSDHPALVDWELEKTYFHGGFEWTARCAADWQRPADMPETRYQKKRMAGHATIFLNFRTKSGA
jgi:tRNA (guanine-N7-)-methyltransferase